MMLVSQAVIDALHAHAPGDVLARLWVRHDGVLHLMSEDECRRHEREMERLAEIECLKGRIEELAAEGLA